MRHARLLLLLFVALAGALLVARRAIAEPDRAYWGNGTLRSSGAGDPGAEHGEWTFWYANGQLRERGRYEHGRRVGVWTQWYANGQRASSGERRPTDDGGSPRQGAWTFWHETGDVRAEGRYEGGRRVGPWREFRVDPEGGPARLDPARSGVYAADTRVADLPPTAAQPSPPELGEQR